MNREYQYNHSELIQNKEVMYDHEERIQKARKTISVLKDCCKDTTKMSLLDIGSSTGIMTNEYAKYFKEVIGIDLDFKAVEFSKISFSRKNLKFINSPIEEAKFNNQLFDVITCSHIYEHVPSDKVLMETIFRLLKPEGICYFAAGNRFKIIEPHYKLPFLSFFPKKLSNKYLKLFTDHDEYYENLKSYRNLKKMVSNFEIHDYTLEIINNPTKYYADEMIKQKSLKYYFIKFISNNFYFLIPTYIWILKKPK